MTTLPHHTPERHEHGTRVELAEDLVRNGVGPGMTLREALYVCERLIIEATIDRAPSLIEAARRLGITREFLWRLRTRYGLPIRPKSKPVPEDWRERLARRVGG